MKIEALDMRPQGLGLDVEFWMRLSELTQQARLTPYPSQMNETLRRERDRSPNGSFAPAYLLWMGDNLRQESRFEEAIELYWELDERYGEVPVGNASFRAHALEHIAISRERLGEDSKARETYTRLLEEEAAGIGAGWLQFQLARIAEAAEETKAAIADYRAAAATDDPPSQHGADVRELARRAADRLESTRDAARPTSKQVLKELVVALRKRDGSLLAPLASPTHFAIGAVGSEMTFIDSEPLLAELSEGLSSSKIFVDPAATEGHGGKLYLPTTGWSSELLSGRLYFVLRQFDDGWEWCGVALTQMTEAWGGLLGRPAPETNQPLPAGLLKAPWPAGTSFRAGGVFNFAAEALVLAGFGGFGLLIAAGLAQGPCGWGPAGFYYNQFGHSGQDAFAVDFTRYLRGAPLVNAAHHVQVLSVSAGVVSMVRSQFADGDPLLDNQVDVNYVESRSEWSASTLSLASPTKLLGKYLHFSGPHRIPVTLGMSAPRGCVLGLMDDTGNSAFDHLHFSIHDRDSAPPFQSVRPTPMDGQTLNDGENYKCIASSNVPGRG